MIYSENTEETLNKICDYIKKQGFTYPSSLIKNLYSYYAAGNSRAKTKVNGNRETYYLRGPSLNNDYSNVVGVVLLDGTISSVKGTNANPLSFSFCL